MKLILTSETLKQRHLESFMKHLRELNAEDISRPESWGAYVRAAIGAEWLDAKKAEEVDEMLPRDVRSLSDKIDDLYREAITIDPN